MLVLVAAAMLAVPDTQPGTGTLWLDGEAHAMIVTLCDHENQTAGARGELPDGSQVAIMLQRWPGLHALSVVYNNQQWVHRGPEDSEDGPRIASWGAGELSASGTAALFPPIREDAMEVGFQGLCPD
ncbi:MAG: hypothetical protein LAT81_02415 [Oceanicaulis sp.]|nr:hypothetical protein [Oceanicaulis sp.]